jgi:hypothetical protein
MIQDFDGEDAWDDGVREDRELFLQFYANKQMELVEEHKRHCTVAWNEAHEAYQRNRPFTAMRCMREAIEAAVQARLCRERAAECMRELHALIRMLAQEFTVAKLADSEADSATGVETETEAETEAETETEADDHPASPPLL